MSKGASVEKGVYYPVADIVKPLNENTQKHWRAVWTGEFRAPQAGEWYLSGAVVEAYQAIGAVNAYRHIATLVNIKDIHWVVTKGGTPVAVCASENDAESWLLRHQGQSNDHAKRYEGYAITEVKP